MTTMSDSEALDHYRDELNRTRRALRQWADDLKDSPSPDPVTAWVVRTTLLRILGERP